MKNDTTTNLQVSTTFQSAQGTLSKWSIKINKSLHQKQNPLQVQHTLAQSSFRLINGRQFINATLSTNSSPIQHIKKQTTTLSSMPAHHMHKWITFKQFSNEISPTYSQALNTTAQKQDFLHSTTIKSVSGDAFATRLNRESCQHPATYLMHPLPPGRWKQIGKRISSPLLIH